MAASALREPSIRVPDDGYRLLDGHYVGRVGCDHRGDMGRWLEFPGEETNLAADPRFAAIVDQLHTKVLKYIQLF